MEPEELIISEETNEILSSDQLLNELREWKEIHTRTISILNTVSYITSTLKIHKSSFPSDAEIRLHDAEMEATRCYSSLTAFKLITKNFVISNNQIIISCLNHVSEMRSIMQKIAKAKDMEDLLNILHAFIDIEQDFDTLLAVSDYQMTKLIDKLGRKLQIISEIEISNQQTANLYDKPESQLQLKDQTQIQPEIQKNTYLEIIEERVAQLKDQTQIQPEIQKNIYLEIIIELVGNEIKYQIRLNLEKDISNPEREFYNLGKKELLKESNFYLNRIYDYFDALASNACMDNNWENLLNHGMGLYDELFPDAIKLIFDSLIKGKKGILLLYLDKCASELPWELIVPPFKDENNEYQFLCERYSIGRWLIDAKKSKISEEIKISPMALISYDPGSLEGIAKEAENLRKIIGLDVNAIDPPNYKNLQLFLQSDNMRGCSSLHLSGDGKYDENSLPEYIFRLPDRSLAYSDFNLPENRAFGKSHPLVFLNFCGSGRHKSSISDIRGWAELFLNRIGSSALITTMWKANDDSASEFSPIFYKSLLDGETLGRSMQLARGEIKDRKDATWLCYVLYGDPQAKIAK